MNEKKYPEPTVGALIFNPENKLFLMTSPKWNNVYVIPGGHVELGETIEQALRREIKEETGLDITDIKFITFMESIFDEEFHEKKHFIFFDYICKVESDVVTLNHEGLEYVWVTLEEALQLPLAFYTRGLILKYQDNMSKLKIVL